MRALLRGFLLGICVCLLPASACSQVLKGSVPPPTGSTILLPEQGFNGGVLTGVVLGPDEKPVANAQLNVADAVPITLSGEVIGDQPSSDQKPVSPDRAEQSALPSAQKPPTEFPSVSTPQECAAILARAQSLLSGSGAPDQVLIGLSQPAAAAGNDGNDAGSEEGAFLTRGGGGIVTDANGRFALCVRPDSKSVNVSFADGSAQTSVPTAAGQAQSPCDPARHFFQPAARLSVCQRVSKATLSQGGQTWELPAAQAISSRGDRVLATLRTPPTLQPGSATLSYVDGSGRAHHFTNGVFRMLSARLDRSKLRSHEGADFEYTAQFGSVEAHPCVHVRVEGPIELVQAPMPQIQVDAAGVGKFSGKIRATQVGPGAAIPFNIVPTIDDCGGPAKPMPPRTSRPAPPSATMTAVRLPSPESLGKISNPALSHQDTIIAKLEQQRLSTEEETRKAGPNIGHEQPINSMPLVCSTDSTPRIIEVNGRSNVLFTPEGKYNRYTIVGCGFGQSHPDSSVYIITPYYGHSNDDFKASLNIDSWNDNVITAHLDPWLAGVLDHDDVSLVVVPHLGLRGKIELGGHTFHAARGIPTPNGDAPIQMRKNTIPPKWVTLAGVDKVEAGFDQLPPNATGAFPTFSYPQEPAAWVFRYAQGFDDSGSEFNDFDATRTPGSHGCHINDGIYQENDSDYDSALPCVDYFDRSWMQTWGPDTWNFLQLSNFHFDITAYELYATGTKPSDLCGAWDDSSKLSGHYGGWAARMHDPYTITVYWPLYWCADQEAEPFNRLNRKEQSTYGLTVWIWGPRCVQPWNGAADQSCIDSVKKYFEKEGQS